MLKNNPPVPGHGGLAKGADPLDPKSYDQYKGQDYAPERINQQALAFIRDNKDRPFFLYYPTIIPHVALHVPDEDLKPYLELGWNDPPFTRAKGGYTPHFTPRAAYAAMISRMDQYVGKVLKLLDELKLADNTIVVFSSDNGTTHLEQEVDYTFFSSVGELRGLKGSLYEGGVRVPTIVRWPGHVPAGPISDRVSGFEDWIPTLLELIGAKDAAPKNIDGISLAPDAPGPIPNASPVFVPRVSQLRRAAVRPRGRLESRPPKHDQRQPGNRVVQPRGRHRRATQRRQTAPGHREETGEAHGRTAHALQAVPADPHRSPRRRNAKPPRSVDSRSDRRTARASYKGRDNTSDVHSD